MNRIANCVFCQICEGTAPSNTIFKNENFIVFACRTQATKHHYLVCPIQHINDAKSLVPGQETLGKYIPLTQIYDIKCYNTLFSNFISFSLS